MLEYTTTIVTAPEATTATAARWEHCIGLIVQAHTELTLRLPKSKAGALAVLARLTAAVEALPDDPHAGQGVLPETLDSRPGLSPQARATLNGPDAPTFSINEDVLIPTAPVWRTLTFGDLRAGDVVRLDEDGDEETVRASWPDRVPGYWWYRGSKTCGRPHNTDPVLVRHPRPEVGQ